MTGICRGPLRLSLACFKGWQTSSRLLVNMSRSLLLGSSCSAITACSVVLRDIPRFVP